MCHIIFWLIISVIILLAVNVKTGFMLFAFFGITVVINVVAYLLSSRRFSIGYRSAVQREFEQMKSDEKSR